MMLGNTTTWGGRAYAYIEEARWLEFLLNAGEKRLCGFGTKWEVHCPEAPDPRIVARWLDTNIFEASIKVLEYMYALVAGSVGPVEQPASVAGTVPACNRTQGSAKDEETKKRAKGMLDEQVRALLMSSRSKITARKVAETLNKNYAGMYKPTAPGAVRGTKAWQQRHQNNTQEE